VYTDLQGQNVKRHILSHCVFIPFASGASFGRALLLLQQLGTASLTRILSCLPHYRRFIARHVHLQHHMQGLFEFQLTSGEFPFDSITSQQQRPTAPRRPAAIEGRTRDGGIRRDHMLDLGIKMAPKTAAKVSHTPRTQRSHTAPLADPTAQRHVHHAVRTQGSRPSF
jgi:hypothetical protein